MGENCVINPQFRCDYGCYIQVGENFYANYNCVILDCAPVTFGDNVFIAPNCGFYTAGHPVDYPTRNALLEFAKPITVGDNVWIGGNVVVLPGVTIGSGSVIGAGSVVSRDIPENVVAVGNPCRPIRSIDQEDRENALIKERTALFYTRSQRERRLWGNPSQSASACPAGQDDEEKGVSKGQTSVP